MGEASCEIAEKEGAYSTYAGSPVSKGQLQYDMWGVTPTSLHDWAALKAKIAKHGAEQSADGSDADGEHGADPRQQRVGGDVHQQHLHQARAQRGVPDRQPAPPQRPGGARDLVG